MLHGAPRHQTRLPVRCHRRDDEGYARGDGGGTVPAWRSYDQQEDDGDGREAAVDVPHEPRVLPHA